MGPSDVSKDSSFLSEQYDRMSEAQLGLGRTLIGRMGIGPGQDVLDAGCGTGRLTMGIAELVGGDGMVVGIDPSPHRVQLAKSKAERSGLAAIRFEEGAAEDLSRFPDGSFDHVVYSSVFHWIGGKEAALLEAFRVLRHDGAVGITTPALDGPFTLRTVMRDVLSRSRYSSIGGDVSSSKRITAEEMRRLLERTGFINATVEVETKRSFVRSARAIVDFYDASSFGNYLRSVPEDLKAELRNDIIAELERKRTPQGIEFESNVMFAIARRP